MSLYHDELPNELKIFNPLKDDKGFTLVQILEIEIIDVNVNRIKWTQEEISISLEITGDLSSTKVVNSAIYFSIDPENKLKELLAGTGFKRYAEVIDRRIYSSNHAKEVRYISNPISDELKKEISSHLETLNGSKYKVTLNKKLEVDYKKGFLPV